MALYDHIYDVEDYFGQPYKELISYFKNLVYRGIILDIGCGQGRDSIPLGKLGYQVIGIDVSKLGIEQINKNAKNQNLNVQAKEADMFNYPISNEIDIILLNSMLHFEKNDKQKEISFLTRIANELKTQGIICICTWKSKTKEKIIKNIFASSDYNWEILNNSYIDYTFEDKKSDHKVDMTYNMFIIKKLNI